MSYAMKYSKHMPEWIKNHKVGDQLIHCDGIVRKTVKIEDEIFYGCPDWLRKTILYTPKWLDRLIDKLEQKYDINISSQLVLDFIYQVYDIQLLIHSWLDEEFFGEFGYWPIAKICDRHAITEDGYRCSMMNCGEEATPENLEANEKHKIWWETKGKKKWESGEGTWHESE